MVKITTTYQQHKHCQAIHEPSSTKIETDAPKDNHGLGESFSPTDLIATSLATCILTTIAIQLEPEGIDISGATASVIKDMASQPRRISSLKTTLHFPKNISNSHKEKIITIAHNCPALKSIHPEILVPIEINFDQ